MVCADGWLGGCVAAQSDWTGRLSLSLVLTQGSGKRPQLTLQAEVRNHNTINSHISLEYLTCTCYNVYIQIIVVCNKQTRPFGVKWAN